LNRNLEGIIEVCGFHPIFLLFRDLSSSKVRDHRKTKLRVGKTQIGNGEFSSVEALWSQFETVMGRDEQNAQTTADHGGEDEDSRVEHTAEAAGR
jgi:hypothetical protein